MTSPDLAVTDGASEPADAPTPSDPPTGASTGAADPLPADVPTDEPPSSEHLANAGALGGDDLAGHLGAESLEAHAAAQVAQGVADGTQAPAGMTESDDHVTSLAAWLDKPGYHAGFSVPGANGAAATNYVSCTLCGGLLRDGFQDWHTETHRRGG